MQFDGGRIKTELKLGENAKEIKVIGDASNPKAVIGLSNSMAAGTVDTLSLQLS